MKCISAWVPDELLAAMEVWIAREKQATRRRVNRTDFLLQAALEKLQLDGIPIESDSALRTGESRPVNSGTPQAVAALDKIVALSVRKARSADKKPKTDG